MAEEYLDEDLVLAVIRKTKPDLEERIHVSDLMEELYSGFVISNLQHDQIKTYTEKEGVIYATGKLLEMVINKKVHISGFLEVLKEKNHKEHQLIEEGVKKFKSGEWVLPGLNRKKFLK